ncbi:hypothetical protein ACI65C_005198 [Semiaphis heraclei]
MVLSLGGLGVFKNMNKFLKEAKLLQNLPHNLTPVNQHKKKDSSTSTETDLPYPKPDAHSTAQESRTATSAVHDKKEPPSTTGNRQKRRKTKLDTDKQRSVPAKACSSDRATDTDRNGACRRSVRSSREARKKSKCPQNATHPEGPPSTSSRAGEGFRRAVLRRHATCVPSEQPRWTSKP